MKRLGAGAVVTDAGPIPVGPGRSSRRARGRGGWRTTLGVDVPIRPVRGWLALLAPGPPILRHAIHEAGLRARTARSRARVPGQPRRLAELAGARGADAAHALGIHQNADGSVLVGASRSAALHEGPESPDALRENAVHACELIPGLAGREVTATWTGQRPFSEDGLPYIGRLDERTVVCAGHGSEGILTGGGSARLAAELVLGPRAVHRLRRRSRPHAAARMTSTGAGTPVRSSNAAMPWPTRTSRPSTARAPRAVAASTSGVDVPSPR